MKKYKDYIYIALGLIATYLLYIFIKNRSSSAAQQIVDIPTATTSSSGGGATAPISTPASLLAAANAILNPSGASTTTPTTTTPASTTPASSTPASSTPASSTPASSTPASSTSSNPLDAIFQGANNAFTDWTNFENTQVNALGGAINGYEDWAKGYQDKSLAANLGSGVLGNIATALGPIGWVAKAITSILPIKFSKKNPPSPPVLKAPMVQNGQIGVEQIIPGLGKQTSEEFISLANANPIDAMLAQLTVLNAGLSVGQLQQLEGNTVDVTSQSSLASYFNKLAGEALNQANIGNLFASSEGNNAYKPGGYTTNAQEFNTVINDNPYLTASEKSNYLGEENQLINIGQNVNSIYGPLIALDNINNINFMNNFQGGANGFAAAYPQWWQKIQDFYKTPLVVGANVSPPTIVNNKIVYDKNAYNKVASYQRNTLENEYAAINGQYSATSLSFTGGA